MNKGVLIVISGPSGGGKGTVVAKLRELMPDIALSISATTRAPREGEIDGVHYHYISREQFESLIEKGEVLEYTKYQENYYGTPKAPALEVISRGGDMILEIEVDGAAQIKERFPDAVTVMLLPPTIFQLEERLRGRKTENEEVICGRLARAREEIALAPTYDYVVVNDEIDSCACRIMNIIAAEHSKSDRMSDFIENFLD